MFIIFYVFQPFHAQTIEMSELIFPFPVSLKLSQYRKISKTISSLPAIRKNIVRRRNKHDLDDSSGEGFTTSKNELPIDVNAIVNFKDDG